MPWTDTRGEGQEEELVCGDQAAPSLAQRQSYCVRGSPWKWCSPRPQGVEAGPALTS